MVSVLQRSGITGGMCFTTNASAKPRTSFIRNSPPGHIRISLAGSIYIYLVERVSLIDYQHFLPLTYVDIEKNVRKAFNVRSPHTGHLLECDVWIYALNFRFIISIFN